MAKTRAAAEPKQRTNEQIRVSEVRVVAEDGSQLGVLSTQDALNKARDAGLDLVEVAPNEKPPVCRIMDFGKFKYQQKKRQSRSHSHQTKLKEIRVRPKTGKNDIQVKVNRARGFLEHKDKVQLTVQFRGREMAHTEEGRRVMSEILEQLADVGKIESTPNQFGRRITCLVSPK